MTCLTVNIPDDDPRSPGRRSAFTMIELIVVSVLMVVLASLIVPRMMGGDERRARAEAGALRDLLTAAGERESMTSQAVALEFVTESEGSARLSLLSASTAGEALTTDPLAEPVRLEMLEVEQCTAAGIVLNRSRWRVPLREGDRRPSIEIVLSHSGGQRWLLSLSSDAVSASLREAPAGGAPVADADSIDLDRSGRGLDPW